MNVSGCVLYTFAMMTSLMNLKMFEIVDERKGQPKSSRDDCIMKQYPPSFQTVLNTCPRSWFPNVVRNLWHPVDEMKRTGKDSYTYKRVWEWCIFYVIFSWILAELFSSVHIIKFSHPKYICNLKFCSKGDQRILFLRSSHF